MRSLCIGMVAVLGLISTVPLELEAQTECRLCESDYYWDPFDPENSYKAHHFDSAGETLRECETVGAPSDLPSGAPPPSGPAPRRDDCESCHNDWVEGGDCLDPPHAPCFGGGVSLPDLVVEVDRLVSSALMRPTTGLGEPVSDLASRVADLAVLTVDLRRNTLRLTGCDGHLITEWSVPEAILKQVAGAS